MLRKSLAVLSAVAALSAPLAAQAKPLPLLAPKKAAPAKVVVPAEPARPHGHGAEILAAAAALLLVAGIAAHGH